MIKNVTIGDKELVLVANGATPYRYRQVFGSDLMNELNYITDKEDMGKSVDVVSKMAFIMKNQAEKADMSRLTEDMFIEWLEQFETMDIIAASHDIFAIYMSNMKSESVAKKKEK